MPVAPTFARSFFTAPYCSELVTTSPVYWTLSAGSIVDDFVMSSRTTATTPSTLLRSSAISASSPVEMGVRTSTMSRVPALFM